MISRFARLVLACVLLMVALPSSATLAVVYPNEKSPRDAIYRQIINGVKKEYKGTVKLVAVPAWVFRNMDKKEFKQANKAANVEAKKIAAQMVKDKIDMVVALGVSGRRVAWALKGRIPLVSGAGLLSPSKKSKRSGISIATTPNVMLDKLKLLAPKVKRIFVVHSSRSRWLVERTKAVAKERGYEISAIHAKNIGEALNEYSRLTNGVLTKTDALWLPPDRKTVDKKNVLKLILEEAWDQRFVVFSSQPEFVEQGVLFSFLPDNEATGIELAKMIISSYKESIDLGIKTTSIINLAVNLRTASHLGYEYTNKQKGRFFITYPTQ